MRITCQVVIRNSLSFIEPIREDVRISLMYKGSKPYHNWLDKLALHDMNKSDIVLESH